MSGKRPYFETNSRGYVPVYTDGACSNNGRQGSKAGIGVWFGDSHPMNVSAPVEGRPTNNTAEIQAARTAISQAASAGVRKVQIHTDSEFVINSATKWMDGWKDNGWKLSSGGQVKNKDEFMKLDEAMQKVDSVDWKYVPGHSNVRGNNMADSLARNGATMYEGSSDRPGFSASASGFATRRFYP